MKGKLVKKSVNKTMAKLRHLVEPAVQGLGLRLWGIEQTGQGKHSVLRIYIDNASGVTIADCERVSRQLSALLAVEQPTVAEYTLEVSSPGLERPLFTAEQFRQYRGTPVNIRMQGLIKGRRKFRGLVTEVTGDKVCLQVDDSYRQRQQQSSGKHDRHDGHKEHTEHKGHKEHKERHDGHQQHTEKPETVALPLADIEKANLVCNS